MSEENQNKEEGEKKPESASEASKQTTPATPETPKAEAPKVDVPKAEAPKPEEKVIQMTDSQLKDIIKDEIARATQTNNMSTQAMTELVDAIKGDNKGNMYAQRAVSSEYIDMGDFLDSPVTFFSYKFIYTIYDDFKYGTAVKTPYGRPIKFHPSYRYKKSGVSIRDIKIVTVSMAQVHSKKEIEWLQAHSKFNIAFFESSKQAESIDDQFADKLAEVSSAVNSMHQAGIVKRAQAEGLPITEDLEALKRTLIMHLAEKKMKEKKVRYVKPVSSDWNPKTDMGEVIDDKITSGEALPQQHY